jgi:integrase
MIDHGWCRTLINQQINRVRRVFKWAVAEEMIPPTVLQGLQSMRGLARGRCRAPESKPIRPVSDQDVQATLPFLSATVQAMVQFQRWTGCRPGEAVQLRLRELDRTQDIWVFRPLRHKTQWVGKEKVIAVGPKAQAAIADLMAQVQDPDAWLFSPKRAAAERSATLRERRKTRVQPSQHSRRVTKPRKAPGDQYNTCSYNRAVKYAIDRAIRAGVEVNHWHVNQLRHTRATELRKLYGIESAASVLGHSELRTTEIYAEKSLGQAIQVAKDCG